MSDASHRVIRKKWVTALRSGQYKQGFSKLRSDENSYCCLGVLCDIYDNTRWKKDVCGMGFRYYRKENGSLFSTVSAIPPLEILKLMNLDDATVDILVGLNDGGKSFIEIAEFIESNLLVGK